MSKIDEKLNSVLKYISKYQKENDYPPSVREICAELEIKSTATAQYYLNKLIERGDLNKQSDKKRSISVNRENEMVAHAVPLVGTVTAGIPILAVENLEGYYPVPEEFTNPEDLFMLRVKGNSMLNAGILDGDKIIVRKQETASNGEIVVAYFDDSATVKRFFVRNGKYILHPENEEFSDIVLDEVQILGKVTGLIRKF